MKPKLTVPQRKRCLLLAKLLESVPVERFNMYDFITKEGDDCFFIPQLSDFIALKRGKCGYAGCAIGWGMTERKIRGNVDNGADLIEKRLGIPWSVEKEMLAGNRLFGGHRKCGPIQVSRDIKRYLKTGILPRK